MKKYKFRLNSILFYRSYLEKLAMLELAKLKTDLEKIENRIKDFEEKKELITRELFNLETRGIDVKEFIIHKNYIKGTEKNINEYDKKMVEVKKEIGKKKREMELQRQKKETLEKMKKDSFDKHMERYYIEEMKEYDEIVNVRNRVEKI